GPIHLTSEFGGLPGGPRNFDVTIHLDHPFFYDPSAGNLLLDIRNFSSSLTSFMDFELGELATDVMGRAFTSQGSSVQSEMANFANGNEGLVTQFTTESVPEPGTACLLLLGYVIVSSFTVVREFTVPAKD